MAETAASRLIRRRILYILLLFAASGLTLLAVIIPFVVTLTQPALKSGDVAPQNYQAPYALTYKSEILTEEQRERAAASVNRVYTPIDPSIGRQQLERLGAAVTFISVTRQDGYASREEKLADLSALEDIRLDRETAQAILDLSNTQWQAVSQDAKSVLGQVMRNTIREEGLNDTRNAIPNLISFSLTEDQANIVVELVTAYVAANSFYNESQTQAARQSARAAANPVARSFIPGETIVQQGRVLLGTDLEALEQFGLTQPAFQWLDLVSSTILVVLLISFLILYLNRKPVYASDSRTLILLTLLFLTFLFGARLIIPGHTVIPYLFPMAAYSLTVAVLFGAEPALVSALPLAILTTFGLPFNLELTLYYVLSSLFGVFFIGQARRITSFFWSGLAMAATGSAVIFVFRIPNPSSDWTGLLTLSAGALIYGIASAGITLVMQFFLAQLLGKTTALQLMELSRPDHPLLQILLRSAPGTYQHSLQVANLVEQAAERIGADGLLTRVGALYHDIGKSVDPIFYIENQIPGNLNPHDDLEPTLSASMVINHVTRGVELARKYRLPKRIQDFITEHHGTLLTGYQYGRAVEAANGNTGHVDPDDFRYPGPRPQSRETALLMLADGCEARVRAEHPKNETELRVVLKNVIDMRLASSALNDTNLTLNDLDNIIDSFATTLRGIYHPRIQYPKLGELHNPQALLSPDDQLAEYASDKTTERTDGQAIEGENIQDQDGAPSSSIIA